MNQAYRALSSCSSCATFSDLRFNPLLVSKLSANFVYIYIYIKTECKVLSGVSRH